MAGFGFGLPGSGNSMNLAGSPMPAPVMGPGLGFGGQPATGGVTLGHLLAAIASGAAAGVSNDRGAIGGAGRGFLAGQQQSQQQLDRQLALEDRAMRKQYLGMQMTSMEQEALDKKAEREAAARHTADLNTFVSSLPPEQQAAARVNPAGFAKGPPDRPFGWNADGTPVTGGPMDPAYKGGVAAAEAGAKAPYTLNKLGPGEQAWWGMTPGSGGAGSSVTPEAFGSALIGPESNGQQFDAKGQPLISSAGAIGKMQVMPNTARQVAAGLGIPYDEHMLRTNPAYNEKLGRAYATQLLGKYGDPGLAAAAYNAGPGAVDAWIAAGKPMNGPQALPAETMAYVPKVLAGLNGGGAPGVATAGGIVNNGGVLTNTNVAGGTWAPATQNGIKGQRNSLSGKFEPDTGQGTGTWEDVKDAEGQVIGQRNTVSGKFDPSPKGVSISQNADGSWSMQMGGSGLTTPTQTKFQEGQFNAANQLARLDQIVQSFDRKWLTLGPRATNWWAAVKDKAGVGLDPTEKQNLVEYTTFRRRTIENFNLTVKEMTGTALSPGEAERIQGAQPVAGTGIFDGDGPTEFKTKLDDVTKMTKLALLRYHFALQNKMDPLKTGIELADVPALIDRRGGEIEAALAKQHPDWTPEVRQIATDDMLKQEFGMGK